MEESERITLKFFHQTIVRSQGVSLELVQKLGRKCSERPCYVKSNHEELPPVEGLPARKTSPQESAQRAPDEGRRLLALLRQTWRK